MALALSTPLHCAGKRRGSNLCAEQFVFQRHRHQHHHHGHRHDGQGDQHSDCEKLMRVGWWVGALSPRSDTTLILEDLQLVLPIFIIFLKQKNLNNLFLLFDLQTKINNFLPFETTLIWEDLQSFMFFSSSTFSKEKQDL